MFKRITYVSRFAKPFSEGELEKLGESSARNNEELGVTGVLMTSGGIFFQILEGPEEAVDRVYSAIANDGRVFSGKLETETGSSITLLAAGGKRHTILRRDIEELRSSNQSVMPEGIEKEINPQDLADLIQFVRETFR